MQKYFFLQHWKINSFFVPCYTNVGKTKNTKLFAKTYIQPKKAKNRETYKHLQDIVCPNRLTSETVLYSLHIFYAVHTTQFTHKSVEIFQISYINHY